MTASTSTLPQFIQQYLDAVPLHRPDASVDEEHRAYVALCRSIASERDSRLKKLMTERLELYCKNFSASNPVLLSYICDQRWESETEEDRELLSRPLHVYVMLEDIVAQYTDSSGYTKQIGGPSRYPLTVPRPDGTTQKVSVTFLTEWHPNEFMGAYYAFGVHKLFVGKAVAHVMDFLQERYGLDFNELENRRRKMSS